MMDAWEDTVMIKLCSLKTLVVFTLWTYVSLFSVDALAQGAAQGKAGSAQGPKRKRANLQYPLLPGGTECEVFLNGDEIRTVPGLGKSKVVTEDTMVLQYWYEPVPSAGEVLVGARAAADFLATRPPSGEDLVSNALEKAIQLGDSTGVEGLRLPRVTVGTKALVMNEVGYLSRAYVGGFPCDRRGGRVVRLLDGQYKGRLVIIPARNLRIVPDEPSPDESKPEEPKPSTSLSDRAKTLLRSGQNLEKIGKTDGAVKYYRQIVKDFPDSPEAKTASDRLRNLGRQ
jgi:hypothetical protein